jgi:hypothetical protein
MPTPIQKKVSPSHAQSTATPARAENKPRSSEAPAPKNKGWTSSSGSPKSPVASRSERAGDSTSAPTSSRPKPSELRNDFHGQLGKLSANQTGKVTNAAHLAQVVAAGYNEGKFGPVSIVPATLREAGTAKPISLVTISGTEVVENQATGWKTNFQSGALLSSKHLQNVRDSILKTVPKGSDIVIAGHSQGGMIAQQLAADQTLKKDYNFISTVAFGSPKIKAPSIGNLIGLGREGEVHRIAAKGDPVPRLSFGQALEPIRKVSAYLGQQNIPTDFPVTPKNPLAGISAHTQDYVNESNPGNQKTDALGRVNSKTPASIEFNPRKRVFFTSPRD